MLRKIGYCVLTISLVSVAGCSKDSEIRSVLTELDAFTSELVQKIDSTQGSIQGIDAAQEFLDSRKGDLKKKLDGVREARGFQVSDEIKKTLTESFTKNITSVASLQIKYVGKSVRDAQFKSKIEKLVNDYRQLLTG